MNPIQINEYSALSTLQGKKEKEERLYNTLIKMPIDEIINYIKNRWIDSAYYKVVYKVVSNRKEEIDNNTFVELFRHILNYNFLVDLNPIYKIFIDRNQQDDLVSLITNLIKEKCNKAKDHHEIKYIKQKDLTEGLELVDSEEEGSIPFISNPDLLGMLWDKYILNIEENPIIKEILLENPIMLNRFTIWPNLRLPFNYDVYKDKISKLLSRKDFHWDAFNEIVDKVGDYSLIHFLACVPQSQNNYIVNYMCECDEIRYRYLLRRYSFYSKRDFLPEERKKMLTRGKEDGSWLSGEAAKYINCHTYPAKIINDDIKNFGTLTIKERFLGRWDVSFKDAIGIILKEQDIRQRFKLYTIKQGYWPIIKHPDLFSLTFEDNTFTAPNSLGGPLINRPRELNKFKFKQIIIKLIYDCNFTYGEKLTISDFLERVKPCTRNIDKGNQIRDDMKEVLKEVIEELNAIGIRIRKDNSLVEAKRKIDKEDNQIL